VRVVADSRRVEVEPGRSATVVLQVLNTADVIDAVGVNVSGIPVESVSVTPQRPQLPPNAAGKTTIGVVVPSSFASGRHRLLVEVVLQHTASPPQCLDIDLDVAERPGLRLRARPNVVRARGSARFTVELVNGGNVALDATLSAHDPDMAMRARFTPQRRRIEPGRSARSSECATSRSAGPVPRSPAGVLAFASTAAPVFFLHVDRLPQLAC
jgi:hypothetical protein